MAIVAVLALSVAAFLLWPDRGEDASTSGDLGLPEPVRVSGAGGFELSAVLDRPAGPGPHPGVLIVPGFGLTTKVGIGDRGGQADPLYRDLGAVLAEHGFVVLRYDKRGSGASRPLPDGYTPTFDDRVADARAALTALRDRSDVDPDRIAIVGHGEGGVVAMRLAGGGDTTAGLVLMNTWGRPLLEVLTTEFVRGVPEDQLDLHQELARQLEVAVAQLMRTGERPEFLPQQLQPIFPPGMEAYMQQLFALDPADDAAGVQAPTLLVHGQLDPDVVEEDVDRLRRTLGAPTVEVLARPRAGHSLLIDRQEAALHGDEEHAMGGPSPAEIRRDREALTAIAEWLQDQLGHG